jgi:hypothetical protein
MSIHTDGCAYGVGFQKHPLDQRMTRMKIVYAKNEHCSLAFVVHFAPTVTGVVRMAEYS